MTLNIEKMKAAALGATKGEFEQRENGSGISITSKDLPHSKVGPYVVARLTKNRFGDAERNALHIATSNPSAVLLLLDALDKVESDRAELMRQLLKCRDFFETDWVNQDAVADLTLEEIYSTLRSVKGSE